MMDMEFSNDNNPNLINLYLNALLYQESTNNYSATHKPSTIIDFETKKPIKVQALGGYGILDINFPVWAKQAGLNDFSMAQQDWKDPRVQDAVAKYKVQYYFDKYNSWDLVSVAWFAGESKADELNNNGTIDFDKADSNGVTIKEYVDKMNNNIANELMTMEIPMQPIQNIMPTPVTKPVQIDDVYAASILDAITKSNAGGIRPSLDADYKSQVPDAAGDMDVAKLKTDIRRKEQAE